MKTYLDCIPCFFKQALEAARIASADEVTQRQILDDVARAIPGFRFEASPPEMARTVYKVVRARTGNNDPYEEIKAESNASALKAYPELRGRIEHSPDPLITAVELAIAGNIIDYGVRNTLNVNRELERILAEGRQKIQHGGERFFQFKELKSALGKTRNILYLADNAGEIVFDRVLLEEIRRQYPTVDIRFAVKEKPAINDALQKDALDCGIETVAQVISSGSDAPGTLLPLCSESFQSMFWEADMVISKGQGNYETLSDAKRPIFFMLLAKCPVIANHIGCKVNDVILHYTNNNVHT